MLAAELRSVDDLNDRVRQLLQQEGHLGPDIVRIGRRSFTVGDEVLALHNDYRLGVLNGLRLDRSTARQFEVITDDGSRLSIPFDYVAAGDLTHGYATTIHKGAGRHRRPVLRRRRHDDTRARHTALSRGRSGNDLYTAGGDPRIEQRQAPRWSRISSIAYASPLAVRLARSWPWTSSRVRIVTDAGAHPAGGLSRPWGRHQP